MKKLILITALAISLLGGGCASPERTAYRSLGATITIVDAGMNGWGDYVRSGRAKAAEETKVKLSYERYQAVVRLSKIAITEYKLGGSTNGPALSRALLALDASKIELLNTIQLFTK